MPNHSKGLTGRITLRTSDEEKTIVGRVQEHMAQCGVTLSANDVILHLIRVAVAPHPLTLEEAMAAVVQHTGSCKTCVPERPPACAAGVHVRDQFVQVDAMIKGQKVKS